LIDQGKTEAEIAEVLSMMEKQIKMGMNTAEERGIEDSEKVWCPKLDNLGA
jgi:hypothetical protein